MGNVNKNHKNILTEKTKKPSALDQADGVNF